MAWPSSPQPMMDSRDAWFGWRRFYKPRVARESPVFRLVERRLEEKRRPVDAGTPDVPGATGRARCQGRYFLLNSARRASNAVAQCSIGSMTWHRGL